VAAKRGSPKTAPKRGELAPLVERCAAALGVTLEAGVPRGAGAGETVPRGAGAGDAATLGAWLDRLQEWNARIDLTAARSPAELVDLMLADALVLASRLPRGASVVDVGAGAGAPGLALALLRDDLRVTLVEPLGKRAAFLRTVIGATQRSDIALLPVRGETLAGRCAWDVAISRATLAPAEWLELGASLVKAEGQVWVLLAKDAAPESPCAALEAEHRYAWPLTGAERRALVYRAL
jgi:16S rRNA (guanine527-N7)-methyltransferase